MASIEGFLDEVIGIVRAVTGIAYAPNDPPSAIAADPAAVVWLTDGRAEIGPPELATYHYGVRVGLFTSMQNIAIANQKILPRIEPVIEVIWNRLRSATTPFANCQNIEQITFTYGPIQWGDIWYFGALIDLEGVKIQREL